MNLIAGIPLTGSLANALSILAGSFAGIVLGNRLSEDMMKLPLQCLGLFSAVVGIAMTLKMQNMLIVVFSLCVGALLGTWLDLNGRIDRGAHRLQKRYSGLGSRFAEGFLAATLLFCIGPMAVLGALEEGLGGKPSLLLTKATMDGLAAVALSAALGAGVAFSALSVLVYQGTMALAAQFLQPLMTEAAVAEMTACGGVLLFGVGLNILGVTKIRLMDALPALAVVVALTRMFAS
ncbi:MAG: DUF554 domain-containing protein [Pyramidobacter sp.]|jgi:uncharacterized membrane protein YqgA involved in biofilm formation